jgi:hypothetical protein
METPLGRVALSYGGEEHDVADLVLVGLLTGEWQALESLVARGLSLRSAHPERPEADELDRVLADFRYERRLLAAADLHAWLTERSLSLSDVEGVLERRWLRARFAAVSCPPADASRVAEVMWADATCAGTLVRCADWLRAWHAGCELVGDAEVRASIGEGARVETLVEFARGDAASGLSTLEADGLRRRATRLVALNAGYERFRSEAVSPEAVEARLDERKLEWTVVTGNELSFELEGAARETRMYVVHDGRTLAQVAETLGLEPSRRELELGSAPAGVSAELLGARAGDLVGPWRENDRWRVLELDSRVEPGEAAGAHLRERAREELLNELIERVSAGKAGMVEAL